MKKILKIDAKLLIPPFFNQCSPFQVYPHSQQIFIFSIRTSAFHFV